MRWLGFAWIAPVVIGLGCGGTVQTETTGGGGSGNSTANGGGGNGGSVGGGGVGGTTTVTTTTSTTVTTTTTGGSGGVGGGTVCEQACGKAEACGAPAGQCAQYIDCNTMQGPCVADCVNDPTVDCNDLFAALQGQAGPLLDCLQVCQGMGQGGAGGAGGGPGAACQQCGQNNCQNAAIQCFQQSGQAECQGWVDCVGTCADAACFDNCTAMFPGGAVIGDCACTSCAADCADVCGGSSGQGGAGGGMGGAGGAGGNMGSPMECQTCGQQQCGAEVQQCFGAGAAQCQAWLTCSQGCQDKACVDACSAMNPAGTALGACICTKCVQTGCGYTCD